MSSIGNAFNAKKGWAVASLFGKVKSKFSLSCKFNLSAIWKTISAAALALMFTKLAHATGTDLLSSQNSTVTSTFGADSSLIKWFYIAEIIMGIFLFIKVRSLLVFVGIVMAIIFTKVGFSIAS
ncbi:type IV conjugative transfer system pilin TraA [Yokenella regensburgei]|uniref:type IV conjugative transfer system pilin TraA n=1 Tax=Yokenella regensburgei TaxID=158877 RepID=UPI00143301D1|nr:type IV conjugative transfer system pilin TraA [Yokenella regensburgei]QIU92615.1 conjugal transfer protein TraA [Yokenella regensburgei]